MVKRHKKQQIIERRWGAFGFALYIQTAPRCFTFRFLWGQHQKGLKLYEKFVR
jgi:hypothetical protein